MAELHVPDESLDALEKTSQHGGTGTYDGDCEHVRVIARPVLVAYLRAKAEESTARDVRVTFLRCIDELEAGRG